MIKFYSSLVVVFLLVSCNESKEYTIEQIENSLEKKLDSLNNSNPTEGEYLADSLLKLDSNNHVGIITKAFARFNNHDTKQSLKYFRKICCWDEFKPIALLMLGWSYEREGFTDSSNYYYKLTYEQIDSTWQSYIGGPQLLTVTVGKEEGMKSLERNSQIPELLYLQLKNDIITYQGGGLSEFFPPFFEDNLSDEFYISIPDSLYDNGIINSMEKVELLFARLGINVDVRSTDSANKGYKLVTNPKYLPELLKTDTLGLKRL